MKEPRFISYTPVIDVTDWRRAEEPRGGKRKKFTLIHPDTDGHYIFKYPLKGRELQIWSELPASHIAGDLLGWDVQHTSIASCQGYLGNLSKYIYEPRHICESTLQEELTEGAVLFDELNSRSVDDKEMDHNLSSLWQVRDDLLIPKYKLKWKLFMDFWARALAFDTLISNCDRHAYNWAVIHHGQLPDLHTRMAPLFDNGSSLGFGIEQVGLDGYFDESGTIKARKLDKFRKKGHHHVRLDSRRERVSTFDEVNTEFLKIYPDGKQWYEAAERLDIGAICDIMNSIRVESNIDGAYFISRRRIQHVCAILRVGLERIRFVLHRSQDNDNELD